LPLDGIKLPPPLYMVVKYQANESYRLREQKVRGEEKKKRCKKSFSIICFQMETPVC
jgi:hypothetical protein